MSSCVTFDNKLNKIQINQSKLEYSRARHVTSFKCDNHQRAIVRFN